MVNKPVFKFPDGDELDKVPFSYVVGYLEEPDMNKRQHYNFNNIKYSIVR